MYNKEIQDIEERIQAIAEDVNKLLSGPARQKLGTEKANQLIDRMNALLKFSGRVSTDNITEVSIAIQYLTGIVSHIQGSLPSMEDSLCEFYTAMLYHSPQLKLVFDHLGDEQKIDLTDAIKNIGGFEIKDAIITKKQVMEYLKREGRTI